MFNKINKDDFFTNTLVIAATELIIMHGGMKLMSILYSWIFSVYLPDEPRASECYMYSVYYLTFLIPIGLCLLYMRLTKAEKLCIFTKGGFAGFLKSTAIGLLIGFGANALLSILCGITGTVTYTFNAFTRYLPILAITVFFQCSCEEFLLRAYAAPYMEEHNHWSAAAFISGSLFIFHHTGNLNLYGFDYRFCLNVFLIGVFLYLLIKVTGNFWSCCGFHTAWNVTQMYIFGLPNSGMISLNALYQGNDAKDSFFYSTVYGHEGSLCATVLFVIMILVLLLLWNRQEETGKEN